LTVFDSVIVHLELKHRIVIEGLTMYIDLAFYKHSRHVHTDLTAWWETANTETQTHTQ